jgi:hypothetical protein
MCLPALVVGNSPVTLTTATDDGIQFHLAHVFFAEN